MKTGSQLADLNLKLAERDHEHTQRLDELAHDLKNPVVLIANALEQCSWRLTPEQLAEPNFAMVRAEVEWVAKFIDHMLDLARASAGRTPLRRQLLYVDDVLGDAVESLHEFTEHQGRRIVVAQQANPNLALIADEALVFKLMVLLLSRAVRTTATQVDVRAGASHDGADVQVDIVVDRRVGTAKPRQALDDLGRPWSHYSDRQFGITGLELELAQWITEAHSGSLTVADIDARSTVIRVTFPTAAAAGVPSATPRLSSWRAPSEPTPAP